MTVMGMGDREMGGWDSQLYRVGLVYTLDGMNGTNGFIGIDRLIILHYLSFHLNLAWLCEMNFVVAAVAEWEERAYSGSLCRPLNYALRT